MSQSRQSQLASIHSQLAVIRAKLSRLLFEHPQDPCERAELAGIRDAVKRLDEAVAGVERAHDNVTSETPGYEGYLLLKQGKT